MLKAKRGFGEAFPNWLELSHMVQKGPISPITNYCAYTFNRNELVDRQKLIRSSKAGARADAHLQLIIQIKWFCTTSNLLPLAAFVKHLMM